jgi:hypothetical protein
VEGGLPRRGKEHDKMWEGQFLPAGDVVTVKETRMVNAPMMKR